MRFGDSRRRRTIKHQARLIRVRSVRTAHDPKLRLANKRSLCLGLQIDPRAGSPHRQQTHRDRVPESEHTELERTTTTTHQIALREQRLLTRHGN